jgi:hypothetical protein
MQLAGGQTDGLAGPQAQPVQQQGRQHTGIAEVALAQLEHRPGFGGNRLAPWADVLDRQLGTGAVTGMPLRSSRANESSRLRRARVRLQ